MPIKQMQWQLLVLGFYGDYSLRHVDTYWGAESARAFNGWQASHGCERSVIYNATEMRMIMDDVRQLQQSLGVTDDGYGGPKTLAAIAERDKPAEEPQPNHSPEPTPVPPEEEKPEADDEAAFWASVPHFERAEFRCKCGRCGGYPVEPDKDLVRRLEQIREHFGRPVIVTSGVRCPAHNASLEHSSPNSQHLYGKAADIQIAGVSPRELYDYVDELQGTTGGLGIYDWGIHTDTRSWHARWDSRSK